MKNLAKTCFTLMIIIGVLGGTYGIYKMVAGNYAMNDPFSFGFILMAYIILVAGAYVSTKRIWTLLIIGVVITFQSCNYAKSNQQVVVSEDCGMSWKKINAGEAVPKGGLNMCYMWPNGYLLMRISWSSTNQK
ncbi:hypothetical protein I6I99_10755 [Sphingobacterium multivorum]|nr:hypothetical protein [Sphingobacterium multivorum]QQT33007.1 hypothetical protein I6I99_10755 [Sphingobacterium multivorum]